MAERQTTYVDLLALALVEEGDDQYSAEPHDWQTYVLKAKQAAPELFRDVRFDRRVPDEPFSEEADHALHVLAQAGLVSIGNPLYRFMGLRAEQRKAISDDRSEVLARHGDVIKELAVIARESLAVGYRRAES